MPVITPAGNLVLKANWPIRSAPSTKEAPANPEGSSFGAPVPASLDAIGPARKATNATGPVTAVAKAIKNTELRTKKSRVRFVFTPSINDIN